MHSVPVGPEPTVVTVSSDLDVDERINNHFPQDSTIPPRSRAAEEVDASPISEDVGPFPSLDDMYFSCDTFTMVADNHDQNVSPTFALGATQQNPHTWTDDQRNLPRTGRPRR